MYFATANTVTVPPNSMVAFPLGTNISVTQVGAGATSFLAGAGVTLRAPFGLVLAAQWAVGSVYKRGTDEWVVSV